MAVNAVEWSDHRKSLTVFLLSFGDLSRPLDGMTLTMIG
ncbi:hypothetical protein DFJ69_2067 [Thermomonospora umbrina]|uniref:Uncharacterized protein n=1 Tax=Thermomonospora umbrina TaxID=111806 RepID=A0A3D9SL97_9ACTN|nr:hypothetical protein DFJ69_2067 [Thermomonospora umbrina]